MVTAPAGHLTVWEEELSPATAAGIIDINLALTEPIQALAKGGR